MWRKASGIILTLILSWAALANIAPDVFQIRGWPLFQWLTGRGYWLVFPLVLAWLAAYLWSIEARIRPLQDETKKREADYQCWLTARTKEFAAAQKADPDTIKAVNGLLSRGAQLRTRATTITTEAAASSVAQVQVHNCLEAIGVWEGDVGNWLRGIRPDFVDDFIADFCMPTGATMRETVIWRIEWRLERLRALKAGLI